MMRTLQRRTRRWLSAVGLAALAPAVGAVPVSLELYLAADVSGSITTDDFNLQRQGFAAAFQSAAVINAISASGGIAVKLVDFASSVVTAVNWTLITDAASAQAFATAVLGAARGAAGAEDDQIGMIGTALADLNGNGFEGTRSVLDIASEGAQSVGGCTSFTLNCGPLQNARDDFLTNGGTTINAIWLNDRDFFGLDPDDAINAFEYGALNVIGGPGAFQTFAADFESFAPAIERKILREIVGEVPEPNGLALALTALALALGSRKMRRLPRLQ